VPEPSSQPTDNVVLAALLNDEWRRLSPYVQRVLFAKDQILYDAGDVPRYGYFPVSAMLSVVANTEAGLAVQVAALSRNEFAGLSLISRTPASAQVVVTIPGMGYRIRGEALRQEFYRTGTFHAAVLAHVEHLLLASAQAVICLRYHSLLQRLSRWLLSARDSTGADVIELTQERIAELLAAQRSAVSAAAAMLQDRALLRLRHGRIRLLKPRGLEVLACECYHVLRRGPLEDAIRPSAQSQEQRSIARPEGSESFGTRSSSPR
jgi:CRP-like cAMP-binding protein